jgi:DnaJ family protein A protein 2
MDMFSAENQAGPAGPNPFADFGNIFGGGFPFGMPGMGPMGRQPKGPEPIVEKLDVTLEQLYNEESVSFTYKQKNYCTKCDGHGSKNGKDTQCPGCNGKGVRVQVVRMGPMIQQSVGECHNCKGKGKIVEENNKCDNCDGKCYTNKDRTISVPLKSGLVNGNKITLQGRGHQFKDEKTDLILVINELPHSTFKRYNDDLFVEMNLKLYQALFGCEKIVTHLDGRKLHISCSGKTDFNTVRKVSGEGIKSLNGNKGDLYIKFTFTMPNYNSLPSDTKTQLKSLLQSFDKTEAQTESQILKTPNLTKTVISDCNTDTTEQIIQIMEHLKKSNKSTHQKSRSMSSEDFGMDSDQENATPGCVQQ